VSVPLKVLKDEPVSGRVEFEEGMYAQLETEPTHLQFKAITKAYTAMAGGDAGASMEVMTEAVAALLVDWNVRDKEGHELPATREGVEKARQRFITPLFIEAVKIYQAQPTPKG